MIIVGLVILFTSFVLAMVNMGNMASNPESAFEKGFKKHIWAGIGTTFGSLVTFVGTILTIIWAVQYIMENYL